MKTTITVNTENMTVSDYRKIYNLIVALSMDCEEYSLDGNFENDEIKKCKQIKKMIEVLEDVPKRRTEWILDGLWKKYFTKVA